MPTAKELHIDTPRSNLAIKAFDGTTSFIGPQVLPIVTVDKQSDKYYKITKDSWLLIHRTLRAPANKPNRIDFDISSDSYFADNYALAAEIPVEALVNADAAIRVRDSHAANVNEALLRDYEDRVARIVTSASNLGSGVALTGTAKFSDYTSSDPLGVVTSGHAYIRHATGFMANTAIMDEDTHNILLRHPQILDMFKYTAGGMATDQQLNQVLNVSRILIGRGIKNNAVEGGTASITNIWGNNLILARIVPGVSPQTATLGLSFRWTNPLFGAPMAVLRGEEMGAGQKKIEILEQSYYQDEKIVAPELGYAITGTL
jgi:hypothetical protein